MESSGFAEENRLQNGPALARPAAVESYPRFPAFLSGQIFAREAAQICSWNEVIFCHWRIRTAMRVAALNH